MTAFRLIANLLLPLVLAAAAPSVSAHGGEDHGGENHDDAPAAVAATVTGGPRASAATTLFEAVAVLQHGQVLFYIDSYDTNAPVTGAVVEIEGEGIGGRAPETAPGVYALPVPAPVPGEYALTLTVETADNADLLALSLSVPAAEAAVASPAGTPTGFAIAAVVAALLLGGAGAWRYAVRRREARA